MYHTIGQALPPAQNAVVTWWMAGSTTLGAVVTWLVNRTTFLNESQIPGELEMQRMLLESKLEMQRMLLESKLLWGRAHCEALNNMEIERVRVAIKCLEDMMNSA